MTAVFAIPVLLRAVAAYFPEQRLWGLSHLAYFPDWLCLLATAVGLLFASRVLYSPVAALAERISRFSGVAFGVGVALIGAVVFWVLRMETYFLGDGASYLAEHYRYVRDLPVSETVLYSKLSAPLTGQILVAVASLAWTIGGGSGMTENPQIAWWLTAPVAGAMYLWIVLYATGRLFEDSMLRIAAMASLIFTPGFVFFFGYVEYYTLVFVVGTAYFLSTVAAVKGRAPLWLPIVLLLLSAALHLMALVALPGLLLLLYIRLRGDAGPSPARVVFWGTAVVLFVSGVWYIVSGVATEGSRTVLALTSFGKEGAMMHYTLLSGAHIGDVLNFLAFAGLPLLVLPFTGIRLDDDATLVSMTHVAYTGFLVLFGCTCFGMARDWDVHALFGSAAAVFAILAVQSSRKTQRRSGVAYLLFGVSLVAMPVWFAVNINTNASVERFRHVMALDDELITGDYALNGYEHLRKYYQSIGDGEQLAWVIRKKIEMVGYPDDIRKYMLAVMTDFPAAERRNALEWTFQQALQRLRTMRERSVERLYEGDADTFAEVLGEGLMQAHYMNLVGVLDAELGSMYLAKMRDVLPESPLPGMIAALMKPTGQLDAADTEQLVAGARVLRSSATLATYCGSTLLAAEHVPEAMEVLRKAIDFDAQFSLPSFYLAEAALRCSPPDPDLAEKHLRRFLAEPEGHRIADTRAQKQLMEKARFMLDDIEYRRRSIDVR